MIVPIRKARHNTGLLDTSQPKPAWLGLEPGEEYLGTYQRTGMSPVALIGVATSIVPAAVVGLYNGEFWAIFAILSPLIGFLATFINRMMNRVYATSRALVFKDYKSYTIIPLAEIAGISFGERLARHSVIVHFTDKGNKQKLELQSYRPHETVEEITQLIAQYGGEEVTVQGGRK